MPSALLTPDGRVAPRAGRITPIPRRKPARGYGLLRLEVQKLLLRRGWSWQRLSDEIKAVCGVEARPTVYAVRGGAKAATPHVVEQFCAALRVQAAERQRLHVAAAVDYGFKVGAG